MAVVLHPRVELSTHTVVFVLVVILLLLIVTVTVTVFLSVGFIVTSGA